jgi:hypothetical protein
MRKKLDFPPYLALCLKSTSYEGFGRERKLGAGKPHRVSVAEGAIAKNSQAKVPDSDETPKSRR